jgi:WD40 repeat protein
LGIPSHLAKRDCQVISIAVSPDCKRLASGSVDGVIRVWDSEADDSWDLIGHTFVVRTLAFSVDGSNIVSGSDES